MQGCSRSEIVLFGVHTEDKVVDLTIFRIFQICTCYYKLCILGVCLCKTESYYTVAVILTKDDPNHNDLL